ncbi:VanZ family protein [Ureibacillus sp. NPDC094379]
MKRYILLIIAIMITLFFVSSMSYQQQTIVPSLQQVLADKPFEGLLSKIEVTYWGQTISVETRGYYHFVEFLIRKASHFVGFGLIGIIIYLLYRKLNIKYAALFAVISTFFIASIDEFHQTFVPGRTGIFNDVLLDTAGAFTLIILFKVIQLVTKKLMKEISICRS